MGDGLQPPARARPAGVIHQHINAPKMLHDGFKGANRMRLILDRALQQKHLRPGGFAIALHGFGAGAILLIGQA